MSWPLSQDYNEAIQSPASNFVDPDLMRGEAVANALGIPMPYSGNFADVYQVRCPDGGRWAVKCFTRQAAGLRERYQEISKHLRQVKLPFSVDFTYLEQGIRVAGKWRPVLKMQWVEGLTLNQFVRQNLDKPAMLEALLLLWGRMAKHLRAAEVAHCDLQHGNVLLVPGTAGSSLLLLKLIDYDGMWVPGLAGKPSGEVGHASYQHPQRIAEGTYSIDVDRFPLLLIATALRALKVKGRALWDKYDNGDNLLFKEADLAAPLQSPLFLDLTKTGDPLVAQMMDILVKALRGRLETVPLLEEVMPEAQPAAAPPPPLPPPIVPMVAPAAAQQAVPAPAPVAATVPNLVAPKPELNRTKRSRNRTKVWTGASVTAVIVIALAAGLAAWAMSGAPGRPNPETPNTGLAQKDAGKPPVTPPPVPVPAPPGPVTKEAFDKIDKGMTLQQLTDLLGGPPTNTAKAKQPQFDTVWNWTAADGATIVVLASQGKVVGKNGPEGWSPGWPGDVAAKDPPDKPPQPPLPDPVVPPVPPGPENGITNAIGMNLVLIPAGKFQMGSPKEEPFRKGDEVPARDVEIKQPFYMGVTVVTRKQYAAFVKDLNPQAPGERHGGFSGDPQSDDLPVVNVSWTDAANFCKWLSWKEKKKYELPTEAEWEYACRAGTQTAYSFGDDPAKLDAYAWYRDNSDGKIHPVGGKKPNAWGLYDMHGDIYQWCADRVRIREGYGPFGPEISEGSIYRGSSYMSDAPTCRSACKFWDRSDSLYALRGFRVVMRPPVQVP